jgi:hypothetical protein
MCGGACGMTCNWGRERDERGCALCKCNPPPVCAHEICASLPPPLPIACLPGTTGGHVCVRIGNDQCRWVLDCTPNLP